MLSDARHINREALVRDAKFLASAKVRRDLRAVDDVLASPSFLVALKEQNKFRHSSELQASSTIT